MSKDKVGLKAKESKVSDVILKLAGIFAALAVLVGTATTFVDSLSPLRTEITELFSNSEKIEKVEKIEKIEEVEEVAPVIHNWETVLDISYVSKGHMVKVNKFASVEANKYKLHVNLDNLTDTSASLRITGENSYIVSSTLSVGDVFHFDYNNEALRLKIINIRKPAWWYISKAMYFTIERRK